MGPLRKRCTLLAVVLAVPLLLLAQGGKSFVKEAEAALKVNDLASAASDKALSVKATTDTYYLHGLVRFAT